jgi:predicted pyridoxine 5'-phosphate oxidase superfamily flavin-nucleotide-binding protein
MAKYFGSIAFTDAVKKLQQKFGSRSAYARMEQTKYIDGLTENEMEFILQRDSFYIATIGENGYPYIQHRGGPKGFLKVLDANRIGFIDFSGNRQYISVGNISTHDKVAIIMVDYPSRTRLKILARAEVIDLKDDPMLLESLDLKDYLFNAERMIVLNVDAYDWNCQQHITPRYTVEEIEEAFSGDS